MVILGILAAVICVSVAMVILASGRYGERFIRERIERAAATRLDVPVHIGRLETNVLSHAVVEDVVVGDGEGPPALRLGTARVSWDLIDLVVLRIGIRNIDVDSLDIHVVRDRDGKLRFPGISPDSVSSRPSGGGFPLSVTIGDVSVRHATVRYVDDALSLRAEMSGIAAEARSAADGWDINVEAAGGGAAIGEGDSLEVRRFVSAAKVRGHTLRITDFRLDTGVLELSGRAIVPLGGSGGKKTVDVTLEGNIGAAEVIAGAYLPSQIRPLSGDFHATASLSLDDTLHIAGQVAAARLTIAGTPVDSLAATLTYADGRLRADSLMVRVFGGAIIGNIEVAFDDSLSHSTDLSISAISLPPLLARVGIEGQWRAGLLSGRVRSSGPLTRFEGLDVTVDAALVSVRAESGILPPVAITAALSVEMLNATARMAGGTVTAQLTGRDGAWGGPVRSNALPMGPVLSFFGVGGIDGEVDAAGTIAGIPGDFRADIPFTGRKGLFYAVPVDSIDGGIRYRGGSLVLDRTMYRTTVSAEDSLPLFGLEGFHGGYTVEGFIEGPLDSLSTRLTADLDRPGYGPVTFQRGRATVEWSSNGPLRLNDISLTQDSLTVAANGSFDIVEQRLRFDGGLAIGGREAGGFEAAIGFADSLTVEASGHGVNIAAAENFLPSVQQYGGNADFTFQYAVDQDTLPHGSINFTVADPRMGEIAFDRADGSVRLDAGMVRVDEFVLMRGSERAVVLTGHLDAASPDGSLAVSAGSSCGGTFAVSRLPLNVLQPLLHGGMTVDGVLNADIAWSGTLGAPSPEGTITLADTQFRLSPEQPPIHGIAAQLRFDGRTLSIEQLGGAIQTTPFMLTGTVTPSGAGMAAVDLKLAVSHSDAFTATGTVSMGTIALDIGMNNFDLAILQPVLPYIGNLNGHANATLRVEGKPSIPRVNGTLSADGISFIAPFAETSFANGRIRVRFSDTAALLDSLSLASSGGLITANGAVGYDAERITDVHFALSAKDLLFEKEKRYRILVDNADITFDDRQGGGYLLGGTVRFGETRYTHNISIPEILALVRGNQNAPSRDAGFLSKMHLNIEVRDSDRMWLDNNIASIRLQPELRVRGTVALPDPTGRVTIEEGYVMYLDRKFEVQQGTLDFVSTQRIDPTIQIKAVAEVRSMQQTLQDDPFAITLTVSGNVSAARVELTSDPALGQIDIVSLLTLGATSDQFTGRGAQGNSELTQLLRERALRLSSQQLSYYATREVGQLLGIDNLSIQGNLLDFREASGPQLVAAEQINNRLKVTYMTAVGKLNEQSIRLDYTLTKFFSVEGQTDQTGQSGLDFKYRIRF